MYYNKKKLIISIMWVIIGIVILILEGVGIINDPIYSGMGGALLVIGILQVIRNVRYHTDNEYKEKIDIAFKDERHGYIRMKAWSWAGYLFVMGAAVVSIILYIAEMNEYGQIVSYCMCAVLVLYWISYLYLSKKY